MKRFLLIIFGVLLGVVLFDSLCWVLLKINFTAEQFVLPEVPPTSQPSYRYEIKSLSENVPRVDPPPPGKFDGVEAFDTDWGQYWEKSNDGMFFGRRSFAKKIRRLRADGTELEPITITLDEHRRRITHSSNTKAPRPKHLLLMGCSFIFGDGVGDQDTLGWKMHAIQNEYDVYNLAFSAYNPSLTYRMLSSYDWLEGVEQQDGLALYFLLPFHIDRFLGNLNGIGDTPQPIYLWEEKDFRYYSEAEVRASWRFFLRRFYMKTNFFKLFQIAWPLPNKTSHRRMARMLKNLEETYKNKFGGDNRFIVVLYPWGYLPGMKRLIKEALEGAQIHFVDFSDVDYALMSAKPTTLADLHPNGLANEILAPFFIEQLKLVPSQPTVQK